MLWHRDLSGRLCHTNRLPGNCAIDILNVALAVLSAVEIEAKIRGSGPVETSPNVTYLDENVAGAYIQC